jgi:hypothetical protein
MRTVIPILSILAALPWAAVFLTKTFTLALYGP